MLITCLRVYYPNKKEVKGKEKCLHNQVAVAQASQRNGALLALYRRMPDQMQLEA